jgi:hypothetical protein
MPAPWVELLIKHGHISDVRLIYRFAAPSPKMPGYPRHPKNPADSMARRVIVSLRLCLGIGDGAVRSQ